MSPSSRGNEAHSFEADSRSLLASVATVQGRESQTTSPVEFLPNGSIPVPLLKQVGDGKLETGQEVQARGCIRRLAGPQAQPLSRLFWLVEP